LVGFFLFDTMGTVIALWSPLGELVVGLSVSIGSHVSDNEGSFTMIALVWSYWGMYFLTAVIRFLFFVCLSFITGLIAVTGLLIIIEAELSSQELYFTTVVT
jgi:fumarate reductase subunit D